MPETTYEMITREWLLRDYEAMEAIWHTRRFKQFCQSNRDRVKKDLEDRRQTLSQKPKKDREEYEQGWLELPESEALDMALRSAFLETLETYNLQYDLDSLISEPHEGAIYFNRKLIKGPQGDEFLGQFGQYILLRIDLTFPKELIIAEFKHILNEWHPRVKQRSRPRRKNKIMEIDKINFMYRAYELVEENLARGETKHQSVLKATLQLYTKARRPRLKNPPSEDKRYQQVMRWHQKAKSKIGDL